MSSKKTATNRGFTIIEVILVLAIAGLIFIMVFVALPTMQRSQRDTQRKNDVGRVVSALTKWRSDGNNFTGSTNNCLLDNNNNLKNNVSCKFLRNYLNEEAPDAVDAFNSEATFRDPTGEPYKLNFRLSSNTTVMDKMSGVSNYLDYSKFGTYAIIVTFAAKCNPSNTGNGGIDQVKQGNTFMRTHFAVRYRLEDDTIYCQDNSSNV